MINPLEQFRSRLRMRHLQLLFVLSEEGSLRKTAHIMALTQPAVTKALHDLESLVGDALFTRTHKGLVANKLGEAAIRYAQLVFADLSGLHEEMTALQSGNLGTLRIGSMGSLVGGLLPRTLAQLTQRHPKLNITVVIDTSSGAHHLINIAAHLWITKFILGLTFKLRIRQLHQNNCRQTFANVITSQIIFFFLE